VEHWNLVFEKMLDNILHVLMDLEYHKVVLVVLVIVVVVEFDSMDHLVVVDQTSFDYLLKSNKKSISNSQIKTYSYTLVVVVVDSSYDHHDQLKMEMDN
jgi:hypothetical protein